MKDEKTPNLKLPLPHEANELQDDLPRLRESFMVLDAHAQATDEATSAMKDALQAETLARGEGDTRLEKQLAAEQGTREQADAALENQISAEAVERERGDAVNVAALEVESEARQQEMAAHDANATAHDALVRRITVGDISPVIGVCWLETGNCTGLWYNCDAEGQPITPNKRYFDYHPVYSAMRRVLVDGQIMVENAPFWFKTLRPESGPFAGKLCKIISPEAMDGFRPYPAFLTQSGDVLQKLYIGAFSGTSEENSKIGSRPDKTPLVSLNFPTMQARCENRNTSGVAEFCMWDFYHYSSLCLLFLIEHCTTESQAILGRGHVDASDATYTNDYRNPTWRGYTGLYGNVWEMCDGFRIATNGQIEMFRNDGSREWVNTGITALAYNGSAPQYAITAHSGNGDGYDFDEVFVPATQGSYTAGTFPDYFYGRSGSAGNVLYVGGTWINGSGAGLFCLHLTNPASYLNPSIGCRLAKG